MISNASRAIPKALKMVPVATLLGAQLYKASTGSLLTTNIAQKLTPSTWFQGTCLMSPSGVKTYRKIDKAIVRPNVEYGNTIWYPRLRIDIESIERIQKQATRQIPQL